MPLYPPPSGGSGTVTDFSAGDLSPLFTTTEATTTTIPALSFALTSAAATTVFGRAAGTSGAPTYSASPQFTAIGNLTTNGFVKTTAGTGTLSVDATTYLTANQNISLTGDVTGGPAATSIATTIGANKVTLGMMATLAADSIIGNTSASPATPVALTSLPWAYTGDVTRAADSNATVLAAGNAGNLNSGTLLAARMPAFTGDVTSAAGATANTLVNIPATTTIAGAAGTRGDVLYYGASGWAKLAAGTSGNQLTTNGAGADPTWAAPGSGGSGTPGGSTLQLQYNNAGAFAGMAGTAWDDTNRSLTMTGATVTTSKPMLDMAQTWNAGAVAFTGLKFNASSTASDGQSLLADFQLGGVSQVNIRKDGYVQLTSGVYWPAFNHLIGISGSNLSIGSGASTLISNGGVYFSFQGLAGLVAANNTMFGWQSGGVPVTTTPDTALARNAAGVVEVNNGTVGTYRDLKLRTLTFSGATTISVSAPSAANGYFLKDDGNWAAAGGGSGDVVGPAGGVVDNQVVLFNSTTGKLIKGATGTGIAKHSSGVLSLVTAPTGALVGDTDTQTLTNKEIAPRVVSVASSATWSPNADTTDVFTITTAQAAAVTTINNPSGSPLDGQKMIFRVKCDGTARALTWTAGTQYRASSDMILPTTLIANKTTYLGFAYNSTDTKWDLLAKMENY